MFVFIDIFGIKCVFMIVVNFGILLIIGWFVGFWWVEVMYLYWIFMEVGYEVEIVFLKGGDLMVDGFLDFEDDS